MLWYELRHMFKCVCTIYIECYVEQATKISPTYWKYLIASSWGTRKSVAKSLNLPSGQCIIIAQQSSSFSVFGHLLEEFPTISTKILEAKHLPSYFKGNRFKTRGWVVRWNFHTLCFLWSPSVHNCQLWIFCYNSTQFS